MVFVPLWIVLCLSLVGKDSDNCLNNLYVKWIIIYQLNCYLNNYSKVYYTVLYSVEFCYGHQKCHKLSDVQPLTQRLGTRLQ